MRLVSAPLLLVASFALLGGCATARSTEVTPRPLRILVTNDDGYRSPGLRAVRAALEEAGHEVVVVAPLENRSGSSSSVTTAGALELREQAPGTWSVGGTPADAVRVALGVVLADRPPDLVVSGANFGQNIGPSTLVSGTVGAALTARTLGVPALAISVGIDPREAREDPRFASTLAAFDDAGEFVARTVASLQATSGGGLGLLPAHTVLNINHPAREADEIEGAVWTRIGRAQHFDSGFEREGDMVRVRIMPSADEESVEDADTTWFAAGYVTLTLLDGDVAAPAEQTREVGLRLGDLGR